MKTAGDLLTAGARWWGWRKEKKKENVCEQVTAKSNNVTIYMKPFQQYFWLVKFAVQYIVMKRNVIFLFVLS